MNHAGLDVEYDLIKTEPEDPKLAEQLLAVCMGSEVQEIKNIILALFHILNFSSSGACSPRLRASPVQGQGG